MAVEPTALGLDIADGVTVTVAGVSIEFDPFVWEYAKTSWPRMSDQGTAAATVLDMEVVVCFSLGTDGHSMLTVTGVAANVDLAALNVEVLQVTAFP